MFDQRRRPSFATPRARGGALGATLCTLAGLLLVGCGATPAGGGDGTGGSSSTGSGGASQTGSGGGTGSGNGGTSGGNGGATGSGGTGTGGNGTGAGGTGAGGAAGRGGTGGGAAGTGGGGVGGGSGGTTGLGGMVGGGTGGIAGSGVPTMTTNFTCTPQTWDTVPLGWATQSGGTTGGGSGTPMVVTSLSALNTAAAGTTARVIQVMGRFSGTATIGSNKTILGGCGAEIDGHIQIGGSSNVILRNLKVVGLNCTDNSDCQSGADAITIENGSSHVWADHLDVSNGSDGNLDITQQSDFVTVSWTKFSYSGQRAGGHQFSNLIGADDGDTSDAGHLRVTWHHDWWGTNVGERMPRARFGQVHVFNSLYTATGDNACIEVGVSVNMLIENNFFMNVSDPIDTLNYSNAASVAIGKNNIFQGISGMFVNKGTASFTPPYAYNLDGATVISAEVMSGAGVK